MNTQRMVVLVTLLALTFSSIATSRAILAAAETETYPIKHGGCVQSPEGYTICDTTKGAVVQTVTPSGNEVWVSNPHRTWTITDPNGTITSKGSTHTHIQELTLDGILHRFSDDATLKFGTCTYRVIYRLVNGKVQGDSIFYCRTPEWED